MAVDGLIYCAMLVEQTGNWVKPKTVNLSRCHAPNDVESRATAACVHRVIRNRIEKQYCTAANAYNYLRCMLAIDTRNCGEAGKRFVEQHIGTQKQWQTNNVGTIDARFSGRPMRSAAEMSFKLFSTIFLYLCHENSVLQRNVTFLHYWDGLQVLNADADDFVQFVKPTWRLVCTRNKILWLDSVAVAIITVA